MARLGHEVFAFDPGYYNASHLWERAWIKLTHQPHPSRVKAAAEKLLQITSRNAFDLVFVMAENFLEVQTIQEIQKKSQRKTRFAYHSHDNVFSPGIMKPANFNEALVSYDFLFTTKSQNVARYQELGQQNAHYIPSAYEPTCHRPISAQESRLEQDFSVTFVGTFDHSRIPQLESAGWDRLHVWGNGWQRWSGYGEHRNHIHSGAIYYLEFADVISRSRCSLGLLREEAEDRHTQRTFEIPACGGLQIAPRNDEICDLFEEDKEIVCFGPNDELKEKVTYYLAHEMERKRLAQAGYQRCINGNHTYQDRVSQMISLLAPALSSRVTKAI